MHAHQGKVSVHDSKLAQHAESRKLCDTPLQHTRVFTTDGTDFMKGDAGDDADGGILPSPEQVRRLAHAPSSLSTVSTDNISFNDCSCPLAPKETHARNIEGNTCAWDCSR
jgi:hypothetical protein